MNTLSITTLETRIAAIKEEIVGIGDIRPGRLTEQARPSRGKVYGTSWSLSYTFQGKAQTAYVPVRAVDQVRSETDNFRRLRELVEEWTVLGIELSKARIVESKNP
jgi:hypothetical protein